MIHRRSLFRGSLLAAASTAPASGGEAPGSGPAQAGSGPVRVSKHWQLFLDDALLRRFRGVTRSVSYPTRLRENPIFAHAEPWEGYSIGIPQVLPRADGTFEMFYGTYSLEEGPRTCYATSADGIHWQRPDLGLIEYRGSRRNNIILLPDVTKDAMLHNVYRDPDDPDPSRRYKMLYFDHFGSSRSIAIGAAFSADGLAWRKHPGNPVYDDTKDTGALLNVKVKDKFVFFHKPKLPVRSIRRIESSDFIHWGGERMALHPDELDAADCEFYGMTPFEYEGIYLGLIWAYHTYPDTVDMQLAWSRDSIRWHRAAGRRIFMPRGRNPESWERYQIYPGGYPVARPVAGGATELWLYYEGWNGPHNQEVRQSRLGLAKIRPHGFVFLDASDAGAMIETRPLEFAGTELLISADIRAGGFLTVRIPGTDLVSSRLEPLDPANRIHRVVWGTGRMPAGGSRPVAFTIEMHRANLFALKFQ